MTSGDLGEWVGGFKTTGKQKKADGREWGKIIKGDICLCNNCRKSDIIFC